MMSSKIETPFPRLSGNKEKTGKVYVMFKIVVYALALFGVMAFIVVLTLAGALKQDSWRTMVPEVPEKAVLTVDFDNMSFSEQRSYDLWAELSGSRPMSFYDLTAALDTAIGDERVKALAVNLGSTDLGLAQIQNLRRLINEFRQAGKKTYLYSSGFGEMGGGTAEYYLASVFDEIVLMPGSEIGITGVNIEVPFLRRLLDRVGIEPEFYARKEYKSAMAFLTDRGFSKTYRQEMSRLGGNIYRQIVSGIAGSRGLDESRVKKLVDASPLTSNEGLENNLITKEGYKPELIEAVVKEYDGELFDIESYRMAVSDKSAKKAPKIAYMVIEGDIVEGESSINPVDGTINAGAETMVAQLDEINQDDDVDALILRINSPGGSYGAAKEIWFALKQLKENRKIPVVVSMGDYAASGGYFIALAGDYIIAEPATVTGSIGVLGGKLVLDGLWQKLGVSFGTVSFGKNAGILSPNRKFSAQEKKVFNRSLDNIYHDFTQKTAEARGLSAEETDKAARGRGWIGKEAVKLKLVDALGGIKEAVCKAAELSGIAEGKKPVHVVYYPGEKSLQEKISELLSGRPRIFVNKAVKDFGFDGEEVNMLLRMQYETALPPFRVNM